MLCVLRASTPSCVAVIASGTLASGKQAVDVVVSDVTIKYLVEWKPAGAWPPSWEPSENLTQDLIDEYEEKWEGSSPSL